MIDPGGGAYVHDGFGRCRANQLGTQAQGAAAAGRLDRAHPPRRERWMVLAENEPLQCLVEVGISGGPHIGLGRLSSEQRLFGLPHGLKALACAPDRRDKPRPQGPLYGGRCPHGTRPSGENRIIRQAGKTLEHRSISTLRANDAGNQVY